MRAGQGREESEAEEDCNFGLIPRRVLAHKLYARVDSMGAQGAGICSAMSHCHCFWAALGCARGHGVLDKEAPIRPRAELPLGRGTCEPLSAWTQSSRCMRSGEGSRQGAHSITAASNSLPAGECGQSGPSVWFQGKVRDGVSPSPAKAPRSAGLLPSVPRAVAKKAGNHTGVRTRPSFQEHSM